MTEPATLNRPSLRPRPAPARPLHVVPAADPEILEVPTSGSEGEALAEKISAGHGDLPAVSEVSRFRVLRAAARTYWTPPQVFTDRPASLAELADYAKTAPWTAQDRGIVRSLGVSWYRLVGYPYTVVSRYREWFAQRPGRLLPALGLIKLFALTGPGDWVVHAVVYPVAHFAGHIFL